MKQLVKNIFLGIAIGSIINTFFSLLFTQGTVQQQILLLLLFSATMGAIPTIYQIEKLSLLAKAFIHAVSGFILFLFVAFIGQWFPFKLGIIASASLSFFLIFFLIWTLFYFVEKKKLQTINQNLPKKTD